MLAAHRDATDRERVDAGLMNRKGTILVIDDEEIMREILETLLTREGYQVRLAANAAEGLELARRMPFDAAIVDVMMPGMDGISALDELKKIDDDLPVMVITAFASVENAIAAMKRGAFDYITKPFKNDEVMVVLRNALAQRRLVAENRALRQNLQAHQNRFGEIVGRSSRMRQVFDLVIQVAPSRTTILIDGESGTGKELIARALHQNSTRADRAFITVNSGNLPPDLLESNLFGHVKGAFTGAVYPKKGLFELADKGTIFFDEIGNVPLDTQAKLLRVIQEREFMRLGGVETIKVDVRIIAATNVDLRRMVDDGRFREDLYYRLHVITVQLPPLRDRKDDIPLLVQHFLEKYGRENQKPNLELTPEALDLLLEYDWPGNVRELENVVERASVLSSGSRIDVDLVPDHVRSSRRFQMPQVAIPPEGISFKEVITDFEKRLIESTLEAAGGVQKRAAELLRIKPTTLNEMIKRHDIRPRRKRSGTLVPPPPDPPSAAPADEDVVADEELEELSKWRG
jgi:DNA-binding NtrC family response regulator